MKSFFASLAYPFRGVGYFLGRPALWKYFAAAFAINVAHELPAGVTAKDLILAIIGEIGVSGGTGYVLEYRGAAIEALSMDERMTVCNMSIEAGARAGMIAPDQTTFEYLRAAPRAPKGADWDAAVARWSKLPSDPGAAFDRSVEIDAATIDTGIGKRDDHLRSADFFDVATYPTISFRSTRIRPATPRDLFRLQVTGDLTMHGVTRQLDLAVKQTARPNAGTIAFAGSATLNRRDFGLTWSQVVEGGGIVVGDEVRISIAVQAHREEA